jgi:alpha-glucosidase
VEITEGTPSYGKICVEEGFCMTYEMDQDAIVYGLGEANRGINKRGYRYISNCSDVPNHTEDLLSLYGAHNFVVIDGRETFGLFADYPGSMEFDIGYTKRNQFVIRCERADLDLYVIEGDFPYDIVKQFRRIIGRSYIPPKFAFGFGQSRWGYKTAEDFRRVVKKHREAHVPMDLLYMDIDYMQDYKDFTVNEEEFPDFKAFVDEMKEEKIHLVPIIDAGVKIEDGYDVYEEGKEKGYFCKREDGSDFEAAVWPGLTHFPDVLNPEARAWFGGKYERLIRAGIDGFWNDMNEPAIFYTPEGLQDMREFYGNAVKNATEVPVEQLNEKVLGLANKEEDYRSFYHNVDGKMVCHYDVHNLFGYNMTRAAGEAFQKISPDKRILLFSRSSYIGMHRYGGIWMGDNKSWWSHILLNLRMLPSLNMCGFLYTGADLGGFGADTTRDLLLRWLALGVFTPLMRNHSALGTREQEFYQFEGVEDFRHIIEVRYRLIQYLYSEYMKAALHDDMMFKPLAFVYPKDKMARKVEDQLMLGDEIMIAPVYVQNVEGRYVYLPEEMKFLKFCPDGSVFEEVLEQGHHYVEIALNEVPLFVRKDRCIPVAAAAETVGEIDMATVEMMGYEGADYELYEDDGVSVV